MTSFDNVAHGELSAGGQAPPVEAHPGRTLLLFVTVLGLLYVFLVSVGLMGAGFKIFGKSFAKALISTTANPFVGLFIGILATSIIQSSSTTTSMVVAFVASGSLTVSNAVPIVMGANIGTTVTCTLVSLAHMSRKNEFRRALSAATVHDFFNVMAVAILLPLELTTHFLQRTAEALSTALFGSATIAFTSPIKVATKPAVGMIKGLVAGLPSGMAGTIVVIVGVVLLFVSLYFITKLMRALLVSRIERFFNRAIGTSGWRVGVLGMLLGAVVTAIVQSSSITTSLLIPMAAAGALSLPQVFPIALGANMGTTVTALLAALAGNAAGLTIAFTHLLFNLVGILLIYPIPAIRRIPMRLAMGLGNLASRSRVWAIGFVAGLFFVVPGLLVFVHRVFA